MACLSVHTRNYANIVRERDDQLLLENISNNPPWYMQSNPAHRLFMRLLKQEAHRRGLKYEGR